MNIRRIVYLPKTIFSRYLTNCKIKNVLKLKSVKRIRREQTRLHELFLIAERHGEKDEIEKLKAKLEVFDWLMKK